MKSTNKQLTIMGRVPLPALLILLSILLLLLMGVAIGVGSVPINQSTVWSVIGHKLSITNTPPNWSMGRENIIWAVRLPRTLLAAMVELRLSHCRSRVAIRHS
ncbi:iron ABC transporter permease [Marinomonas rhodophyticola]|uniref:Iron ABC transporter permease n=1 Tax=Marinomonas rhodophyticola TaxID=2992803 RepID=A0ABT3KJE1_9GAMM|nr:iron ABC transporter permease [Marinomonas sp. KJ51-3]MCW4630645.1 iron ABC transporter permease [Marinomonas sp. KJ51-3]